MIRGGTENGHLPMAVFSVLPPHPRRWPAQFPPHSEQPQEQPLFFILYIRRSARNTAKATPAMITISAKFMFSPPQTMPAIRPITRTSRAAPHATAHCQNTTYSAHPRPSSRRTDATDATHGV